MDDDHYECATCGQIVYMGDLAAVMFHEHRGITDRVVDILHHGTFDVEDLEVAPPPKNPVLLKSGGPIMELIEELPDGRVVCEWEDGRATFPRAALYKLVGFD